MEWTCPKLTPHLGPGVGDLETPTFHYRFVEDRFNRHHRQLGARRRTSEFRKVGKTECFVQRALAKNPTCPNTHELEGRYAKAFCYRRILYPYYLDCR